MKPSQMLVDGFAAAPLPPASFLAAGTFPPPSGDGTKGYALLICVAGAQGLLWIERSTQV